MSLWQQFRNTFMDPPATFGRMWEGILTSLKLDNESRKQMAFTVGVIALSAKMAVADGVVTDSEVRAFYKIIQINDDNMPQVCRLYELFNKDVSGFEAYAQKIARYFDHEPQTRQDLLDALFHIAKADGVLHEREMDFLEKVAHGLNLTNQNFAATKARHVFSDDLDPYAVLGVSWGASEKEIRNAYLKIIKSQHPDRLHARGLAPEFMAIANEKTAMVNNAYNLLKAQGKVR